MALERQESVLSQLFSERPNMKDWKQLLGWIIAGASMALLCAALILFILIYHLPEVSDRDNIREIE